MTNSKNRIFMAFIRSLRRMMNILILLFQRLAQPLPLERSVSDCFCVVCEVFPGGLRKQYSPRGQSCASLFWTPRNLHNCRTDFPCECTQECLTVEGETSLASPRLTRALDVIMTERENRWRFAVTMAQISRAINFWSRASRRRSRWCIFSRDGQRRTDMWRASTDG